MSGPFLNEFSSTPELNNFVTQAILKEWDVFGLIPTSLHMFDMIPFSVLIPKLWKNTTPFMTLTNNYAYAIMKQKKTKIDYFHGLSVFLFIVNKLGPLEKPFHKLELRVSSGFPNTQKQ